jgi:lipopolysaccharide/colanic/teichoic acid biosynthesis glycosyltransferase
MRVIKRLIDIVGASAGLAFFIVPLLLLCLIIWSRLGWPVLFSQARPGLNGKAFTIFKLRTMLEVQGADGALLSDEKRLTDLGRFIRSTSLDELPALWNVLKGEMSLVGPRPLLMEYLPLYSKHQARRHEVLPGITGWAQVNGRNNLSWEEKFDLDVWYVDHWSVGLDFKIIFLTLARVILKDGINAPGSASMPKFMGSAERK